MNCMSCIDLIDLHVLHVTGCVWAGCPSGEELCELLFFTRGALWAECVCVYVSTYIIERYFDMYVLLR